MTIPPFLMVIRRRLPLSNEGLGWLILSVAMLATGLIKSINLITLLACVFWGVGLVNIFLAWRQLRGLRIDRDASDVVVARQPNPWPLHVTQNRPRSRSGLVIVDAWPDSPMLTWLDLPALPSQTIEGEVVPIERGSFDLGPLIVRSGYPLGLAAVERHGDPMTVFVAPPLGRLQRGVLRHWLARRSPNIGSVRTRPIRHPTGQMEFHGLRSFRPGDSPRLIHWRTSARRGELMVREFEEFPNDDLVLVVDLVVGDNTETFERMLSLIATIVWEWCRQKGDCLTVLFAGETCRRFSGSTGVPLRNDVLRALATAQPAATVDRDALHAALDEGPTTATTHLVVGIGASELIDVLRECGRNAVATMDVGAGEEADFFEPPDDHSCEAG